ncbi:MAG: hypothetical protein RIC14_05080 [Filomicrobium sp.]
MIELNEKVRAFLLYAGLLATVVMLICGVTRELLTVSGDVVASSWPVTKTAIVSAKSRKLRKINGSPALTYTLELKRNTKHASTRTFRKQVTKEDYDRVAVGTQVRIRYR